MMFDDEVANADQLLSNVCGISMNIMWCTIKTIIIEKNCWMSFTWTK